MIRMKLKPIVCALTIGSTAVLNAACNVDGAVDSVILEAHPAAQYALSSGSAGVGVQDVAAAAETAVSAHPTHVEMRHFAIYSRYRTMTDSSGGGAVGTSGSAYSLADDEADDFLLWGSRLFGVEHLFCPAEGSGK
jgi:hypothetical protein